MNLMFRMAVMACLACLCLAVQAFAAPRTFTVLPFEVNGPQGYGYLSKAVPSTLASRLGRGGLQAVASGQSQAPSSVAAVQKAQSAVGAEYVLWGAVNVKDNDCTLNIHVRDRSGKEWNRSTQTSVSNMTNALAELADGLGAEVFGLAPAGASGRAAEGPRPAMPANAAFLSNEATQRDVYLNPQFRYQGAGATDGSRLRSQTMQFVMVGMCVGDFDGDKRNEVAILGPHHLYIYRFDKNGQMTKLAETVVSMSNENFLIRTIDLDHNGTLELVVNTFQEDNNRPQTFFYTFAGGKLREYCQRSEYFANVVNLPPNFTPTLIGQAWDSLKLFQPGIHLMVRNGDKYVLGSRIEAPKGANVYNFNWLPGGQDGGGDKVVMYNPQERIKVFSAKGSEMHTTMDRFSGSSVGMDHYKSMPGMGVDRSYQLPDKYYAPLPLLAADLEGRGEYVLLVNKPISTASQFFERYRYFPQGEIHALYWDGVGLGLKWKTRRIRGSVAAVALADVNNDGVQDLVVGLNTHPGVIGTSQRRCIVTAYPLDTTRTNPNTPPDISDFE